MQNNSHSYGRQGEKTASEYLKKSGYTILETNWRFRKYEVDIIASKATEIIFVEVKTRFNSAFGEPELFVSNSKQKFLVEAAHHYLVTKNIESEARFDIIAVTGTNSTEVVKHLEGAFYPQI